MDRMIRKFSKDWWASGPSFDVRIWVPNISAQEYYYQFKKALKQFSYARLSHRDPRGNREYCTLEADMWPSKVGFSIGMSDGPYLSMWTPRYQVSEICHTEEGILWPNTMPNEESIAFLVGLVGLVKRVSAEVPMSMVVIKSEETWQPAQFMREGYVYFYSWGAPMIEGAEVLSVPKVGMYDISLYASVPLNGYSAESRQP